MGEPTTLAMRAIENATRAAEKRMKNAEARQEHAMVLLANARDEGLAIVAAAQTQAAAIERAATEQAAKTRHEAARIMEAAEGMLAEARDARRVAIADFVKAMKQSAKENFGVMLTDMKQTMESYFKSYEDAGHE